MDPPPSPPAIGTLDGSRRIPRSSTVTIVPRMLINPRTYAGAPGTRVRRRSGMISCVASMSHPYVAPRTRNSSVGARVASGIDAVEAKELERVDISDGNVRTSGDHERAMQLFRQGRAEIDGCSSHGMT